MSGNEIKKMIHGAGVKLWEVADALGMRDNDFSRRLRKEFSDAETQNIRSIVDKIVSERT